MATPHLSAKGLECAELELFNGAVGFLHPLGDLFDGALLNESLANHLALNSGKVIDEAEEAGVVIDGFQIGRREVRELVGVISIA
jgi:hypothetical protein